MLLDKIHSINALVLAVWLAYEKYTYKYVPVLDRQYLHYI